MISLIDGHYQYILAEATPLTPLRSDSPLNKNVDILLGNVRIPRNWGLCEQVLDPVALANGDPGIIIINDLSQSGPHCKRSYVKEEPYFRFYAGTPIKSPNGTIVGSMCIFDGPERSGMAPEDILYLQDLAATVMEYLVTYTLKDQHRRGAEGLHGLLTFAEADSNLKSFHEHYNATDLSPGVSQSMKDNVSVKSAAGIPNIKQDAYFQSEAARARMNAAPSRNHPPERRPSVSDLQDRNVPTTTRELFARAAHIMRKSSDMDGVMFLDASIAATSINKADHSPTRAR